jgi:DnaJ-class molecular chaperone
MKINKSAFFLLLLILKFSETLAEDFYTILGVSKQSTEKELKSAYRKLSAKYHPDKNQGDKSAQDMFIRINKAYETLSDPEKKKIYDIYGEEGLAKGNQLSEFNKPRGQNAFVEVEVELEELYNGASKNLSIQKNVVCSHCHGTGGKLGQTSQCPKCKGRGQVVEDMDSGMGFTFKMQNTCNRCGGKGIIFKETCPHCKGRKVVREEKTLKIEVERGMKSDEKITFPRESEQHPDIIPGDLIVTLKQKPHYFFHTRKNDDLYARITLSLKEALLGYERTFKHLDGRTVRVTSNKPTQPFQVTVLENEGMPVHNFASSKGVLYLEHIVRLPSQLTEEEKKLVEELFSN